MIIFPEFGTCKVSFKAYSEPQAHLFVHVGTNQIPSQHLEVMKRTYLYGTQIPSKENLSTNLISLVKLLILHGKMIGNQLLPVELIFMYGQLTFQIIQLRYGKVIKAVLKALNGTQDVTFWLVQLKKIHRFLFGPKSPINHF